MALASWQEWQDNASWLGEQVGGMRQDQAAYEHYADKYNNPAGPSDNALRVWNDAHGFTSGVATDNAPKPSGHHKKKGKGGEEGAEGPSMMDMLMLGLLGSLFKENQEEPGPPPAGEGLSGTILTRTYGNSRKRRTYLRPTVTDAGAAPAAASPA